MVGNPTSFLARFSRVLVVAILWVSRPRLLCRLLGLFGKIDVAADRFRSGIRDLFAVQNGEQSISQVAMGGLLSTFAETGIAIVDASEVKHFAAGREDRSFR